MKRLLLILTLVLAGCARIPDGVTPVRDFQLDRYLGKWYEIARLDHPFERGMSRVTAEYSLGEDGSVKVVNRGYLAEKAIWKEAVGKARFVRGPKEGFLKVSFFGPFYGSYVICGLDPGYGYALVCGPSRSYLWILSRTPELGPEVRERLVAQAGSLGFDTDKLIFVDQQ